MNLTTDPWIPVVNADGLSSLASLHDVFAGDHRDLAMRPHERVALMRLLLCVAHAALEGPRDRAAWKTARQELPGKAKVYLDDHRDKFELFHTTKPFLQFAGLEKPPKEAKPAKKGKAAADVADEEDKVTSASKLDFALATGDKSTLFDHQAASETLREFTKEQLALMLITFQCFAPSQPAAALTWKGQNIPSKGGKPPKGGKTYCGHAPCSPSAMLHCFIRGGSLLDTIHANLVTRRIVQMLYGKEWGKPVWESMPVSVDDLGAIKNATETFLGRMAPLARTVSLDPNCREVLLANGLDYPSLPDWPPEPSAASVLKSDGSGHALVGAGAGNKGIWRELPSIVMKRKSTEIGGPLCLTELAETSATAHVDIWVGALVATKDKGIIDTVEAVQHLPSGMLKDEGRLAYEAGVRCSEQEEVLLIDAALHYRKLLEPNPKLKRCPEAAYAKRRFWTDIELSVPLLKAVVTTLGTEDEPKHRAAWEKAVRRASTDALDAACPHETPRQQRAHALARRALMAARRRSKEPQPASPKS